LLPVVELLRTDVLLFFVTKGRALISKVPHEWMMSL
jgi:hypothetical protein